MPAEFSEDDLIAADRIAEQQDHGAPLHHGNEKLALICLAHRGNSGAQSSVCHNFGPVEMTARVVED